VFIALSIIIDDIIIPFSNTISHQRVPRLVLISGMVGLMGTATLTKKRMGYVNTKMHGIIAMTGLMLSMGGFYVIYENKNQMGKDHFTTWHSWGEKI
jgi:intracellular septation protein A